MGNWFFSAYSSIFCNSGSRGGTRDVKYSWMLVYESSDMEQSPFRMYKVNRLGYRKISNAIGKTFSAHMAYILPDGCRRSPVINSKSSSAIREMMVTST